MGTINWSDSACDDPAKAIALEREDGPKLNWCIGSSAGEDTLSDNIKMVRAIVGECSEQGWSVQIRLWNKDRTEIGDENTYFPHEVYIFDSQYYILVRRSLPQGGADYGVDSHTIIPLSLVASLLMI